MSLVIATNTSAQFAQDALRANQHKTATAMQRLATGLRINSARDDAAGLAISQSMTSQIRGLNQAVRNINDGINLLQTAEGGLGAITDMLQRMRELAVQSANGTYSGSQRAYLQKEAAALQEQISKVVDTTTWNDKKLLDGSFTGQKIQVGAASGATMEVSIPTPPTGSTITTTTYLATRTGNEVGAVILSNGELAINGTSIGTAASASAKDLAAAINVQSNTTGVFATAQSTIGISTAVASSTIAPTIDLGSYGKLIRPLQVDGGKIYYYWDKNGDGGINGDYFSHVELNQIFTQDVNGVVGSGTTTDVYRFSTINGIRVALPTMGGITNPPFGLVGTNQYPTGTAIGSSVQTEGSNQVNAIYDDYLAIWDAYNGIGQGSPWANPPNWNWGGSTSFWTATQTSMGHAAIRVGGDATNTLDNWAQYYVALQVFNPPQTFTSIASGDVRINGVALGAIPSAASVAERSSQVLNAINAQTSLTGVMASADSNTDGIALTALDGRNIEISTLTSASISGSSIGINLNGLQSADRTVTTFRSALVLTSTQSDGINISSTSAATAASGLPNGSTPPTTNIITTSSAIDISTAAGASRAIGVIDNTLDSVNRSRSTIGSYINRLNYAGDNATNIATNLAASRSTIMDADYAEESAKLAKSQIIQQAATAMLAQANQQPQSVLALLKNL